MKIEEIYAIPADGDGWKLLPNGNKLMIGANVQAPDGLDIARIGDSARIGDKASIGEGASIGAWASIGEGASIGAGASIPSKIKWDFSPLAVQGTRHIVTNCAPGQINIGCKFFTFKEFQESTPKERTAYQLAEGYTPKQCAEYIRIVEFVISNGVPERSK